MFTSRLICRSIGRDRLLGREGTVKLKKHSLLQVERNIKIPD